MQIITQGFFNGLCCEESIIYNFDADANWQSVGIVSQITFDVINLVTTSDFVKNGNNIKANVISVGNAGILDLSGKTITNVNNLSISAYFYNLVLSNNLLTTSSYTAMEAWANNLPNSNVFVDFSNNIDSVSGTNLEVILISKGWSVLA
jgi:hypothetical protein